MIQSENEVPFIFIVIIIRLYFINMTKINPEFFTKLFSFVFTKYKHNWISSVNSDAEFWIAKKAYNIFRSVILSVKTEEFAKFI